MVGQAGREHLGLVLQAAEGAGVNYAAAVALEIVAIGMGKLGVTPAARAFDGKAKMRERRLVRDGGVP
jgi:hypothetical protein